MQNIIDRACRASTILYIPVVYALYKNITVHVHSDILRALNKPIAIHTCKPEVRHSCTASLLLVASPTVMPSSPSMYLMCLALAGEAFGPRDALY